MNLAILDIFFIGIIALSALRCAVRGLVSEVLSMAALIIGILSAIFFFRRGALFVRETFMPGAGIVPEIIAFAGIFLIIFVVIKMIEVMLKNIVEGIHLGGLDRFLGLIFGCAEGLVIVCLVLFVISIQPLFDPVRLLENSFFAQLLLPFIMGDFEQTKEMMKSIAGIQPWSVLRHV